jgi:hypothetical protein
MAATSDSDAESTPAFASEDSPEISVCEGSPGRVLFMESGNSDGWISTDFVVEPWE